MKNLVIANQSRDTVISIMTEFHKEYDLLLSPMLPLKATSYLQDMAYDSNNQFMIFLFINTSTSTTINSCIQYNIKSNIPNLTWKGSQQPGES